MKVETEPLSHTNSLTKRNRNQFNRNSSFTSNYLNFVKHLDLKSNWFQFDFVSYTSICAVCNVILTPNMAAHWIGIILRTQCYYCYALCSKKRANTQNWAFWETQNSAHCPLYVKHGKCSYITFARCYWTKYHRKQTLHNQRLPLWFYSINM